MKRCSCGGRLRPARCRATGRPGHAGRYPSECAVRDRKAGWATDPIGAALVEQVADFFAEPSKECTTWPCGRPRGWPRTGRRRVDEGLVQRGRWTRRAKERKSHREATAYATASGTGSRTERPGGRDLRIPATPNPSRYSIRVGRTTSPPFLVPRAQTTCWDVLDFRERTDHRPWRHCRLPDGSCSCRTCRHSRSRRPRRTSGDRIRGVRREQGVAQAVAVHALRPIGTYPARVAEVGLGRLFVARGGAAQVWIHDWKYSPRAACSSPTRGPGQG